jgi:hypothetical protein
LFSKHGSARRQRPTTWICALVTITLAARAKLCATDRPPIRKNPQKAPLNRLEHKKSEPSVETTPQAHSAKQQKIAGHAPK